jgi:hypothetical protein
MIEQCCALSTLGIRVFQISRWGTRVVRIKVSGKALAAAITGRVSIHPPAASDLRLTSLGPFAAKLPGCPHAHRKHGSLRHGKFVLNTARRTAVRYVWHEHCIVLEIPVTQLSVAQLTRTTGSRFGVQGCSQHHARL